MRTRLLQTFHLPATAGSGTGHATNDSNHGLRGCVLAAPAAADAASEDDACQLDGYAGI